MANNKCKECGCVCNKCVTNHDVHLHVEIENLKQRLVERDNHIVTMETTFLNEANKFPNGEFAALRDELVTWQDKYSRLYEAHKRVQKVNQSLEDKLLKLVDKTETEKTALTKDVATLSHRLADANYTIQRLQDDNEKYKNDVNLAIQLLQCKPGNFVSHRIDSLPNEVQAKVSSYVASRRKPPEDRKPSEARSIKVPIPTFPPTAMVYSIPKTPSPEKDPNGSLDPEKPQVDLVSAAIMAKILEEREKERCFTKHCDSCTCSKQIFPPIIHTINTNHSVATQTGNQKCSLCLKCNNEVESRSPLGSMKIVKTVDLVTNQQKTYPQNSIFYSETCEKNKAKLSVSVSVNSKISFNSISDSFVRAELKTRPDAAKIKSDTIDPQFGHHRLCEQSVVPVDQPEKNVFNENVKGPRYCSMRVQSGSKNILLDNIHGSYAPVLYTRQESDKKPPKPRPDCEKAISVHQNTSRTGSTSSDERKSSLSECDNSFHKQQRVAEWIQNIDENDTSTSSSDNSKNESSHSQRLSDFDAQQYAQIETNVKNFLFKSEILNSDDSNTNIKSAKKNSNVEPQHVIESTDAILETKNNNKPVNVITETEI